MTALLIAALLVVGFLLWGAVVLPGALLLGWRIRTADVREGHTHPDGTPIEDPRGWAP